MSSLIFFAKRDGEQTCLPDKTGENEGSPPLVFVSDRKKKKKIGWPRHHFTDGERKNVSRASLANRGKRRKHQRSAEKKKNPANVQKINFLQVHGGGRLFKEGRGTSFLVI